MGHFQKTSKIKIYVTVKKVNEIINWRVNEWMNYRMGQPVFGGAKLSNLSSNLNSVDKDIVLLCAKTGSNPNTLTLGYLIKKTIEFNFP